MSSQFLTGLTAATSTTVTAYGSAPTGRVEISIPAVRGARVYIVSASLLSDFAGLCLFQDATFSQSIVTQVTNTAATLGSSALFLPDASAFLGTIVSGTGVPAATLVTAYTSSSAMTMSRNATASDTSAHTYTGKTYFHLCVQGSGNAHMRPQFSPSVPIPITDVGNAGLVALDANTTARLSVVYGYGI